MPYGAHSLFLLGRWTLYLGCILILRFFMCLGLMMAITSRPDFTAAGLFALQLIVPGIIGLIIFRWIEDGHLWAYVASGAIAAWSIVPVLFESLFVSIHAERNPFLFFNILLTLPGIRVFALMMNAWPNLDDILRERRRRNRPQGFTPIMPGDRGRNASLAESKAEARKASVPAAPVIPIAVATKNAPPLLPRFIPETMVRAARSIRGIGYVLLLLLVPWILIDVAVFAHNQPEHTPLPMLACLLMSLGIPGAAMLIFAYWITRGRLWPVIAAMACAVTVILFQAVDLFCLPQNYSYDLDVTGGLILAVMSSTPCIMAIIVCLLVWSDASDANRAWKREKMRQTDGANHAVGQQVTLPPRPLVAPGQPPLKRGRL